MTGILQAFGLLFAIAIVLYGWCDAPRLPPTGWGRSWAMVWLVTIAAIGIPWWDTHHGIKGAADIAIHLAALTTAIRLYFLVRQETPA